VNRKQMLVDKRLCCPSQDQKTQGLIVHVTDNLYPDPSAFRGQLLHD